MSWFVPTDLDRLAAVDLAEVTPPGTTLTPDEEGGFAVFPTLVDIRATGFLTNGAALRFPDKSQPRSGAIETELS